MSIFATKPTSDPNPQEYNDPSTAAEDATAAFVNPHLLSSLAPTTEQCILHLRVLEIFYSLREAVSRSDGVFGILDKLDKTGEQLEVVREKRWAVYVARAADRFGTWWSANVQQSEPRLKRSDMCKQDTSTAFEKLPESAIPMDFTLDNLPPLDVLMVWHAYILHPRCFLEDCIRFGKVNFWAAGFPWLAINSAINTTSFNYSPSSKAISLFESKTGLAWDNLNDPPAKSISCPGCQRTLNVPWTKLKLSKSYQSSHLKEYFESCRGYFESGRGFSEKYFIRTCAGCRLRINHDLLRVKKFKDDVRLLQVADFPLPGTVLSFAGLPEPNQSYRCSPPNHANAPNILMAWKGYTNEDARNYQISIPTVDYAHLKTMDDVKMFVEKALLNFRTIQRSKGISAPVLFSRESGVAVRRMMSHYWGNSSTFSLDLVGAVIRQGTFIEKMHKIDWYHSPTAEMTMCRFINKYGRFIELIRSAHGRCVVPTLDIDLVWHTHQLSPKLYYQHSLKRAGKFIDHDDKIEQNKLSDAFEWTSKTYQLKYGEVYSECSCWYCEAVRASHMSSIYRFFSSQLSAADRESHKVDHCDNMQWGPHISAHNSVAVKDSDGRASKSMAAHLEQAYGKACKRARDHGWKEPKRDEYFCYNSMHGDSLYLKNYAPYMPDPCITATIYSTNPACMTVAPGASGNCAALTCVGSVAAGACAESHSFSLFGTGQKYTAGRVGGKGTCGSCTFNQASCG